MNHNISIPPAASPLRPTRTRLKVLAALCSMAFLCYLDRNCISRMQKDIAADLRLGALTGEDRATLRKQGGGAAAEQALSEARINTRMSWVFTAFLLGYVLLEIPGGWLGDIWGPRRVIVRIVVWWSLFTALTGSVRWLGDWLSSDPGPELWWGILLTVRFLFGLGEAGAFPNIARALGRWFPLSERAVATGGIWMASRLGGACSPILVGLLINIPGPWQGWQQAFWILGMTGAIWAIWFFFWYRDQPEELPSVNAAESEMIRRGDNAPGSIYDDRSRTSMPWRELILSPNVLAIYLASFCVSYSFYFYLTFLPKFLNKKFAVEYGQSELMSGLPLFLGAIACVLGGRLSDRLGVRLGSKRWGRSLPGALGFGLAGLSVLAAMELEHAWTVVAMLSLAFVFQDLAVPALWSLPVDVGGRYAGTLGGSMNTIGALGGSLCPLVTAQLANKYGWSSNYVLLPFALSYLLGAAAWLFIDAGKTLSFKPKEI